MGPKITVDSASMANKGLELIEAHWLFGLPAERLKVVIHPPSLVHAIVQFKDGCTLAQMSPPSMTFALQFIGKIACQDHIGTVYTLTEILNWENSYGLGI